MPRRKGRVRLIGAVIVLVLAGCGGDGGEKPRLKEGLKASGGDISGTLYLLAGESEFNADVYRVRGSLDHVERLTENGRVSWITAQPGAVVTANARGAGSDHVEALNLMGARGSIGVAILGIGLSWPASAPADAGDRVSRVVVESYPAIVRVDGASASAQPLRGVRRVLDARGRTVSRSSFSAGAPRRVTASTAAAGYECVNNRQRWGFVAYAPWKRAASQDAYYFQFIYGLYKQNRARTLVSTSTGRRYRSKQYEMCSTGGAHARGGNHLSRAVTSFATSNRQPRIIGWKWGKGTRQNTVSASLGFAIPVGPVTINGSVDVHPQDTFTGGQGPDKDASDAFDGHEFNQVNAMWEGSDTFRWQGSTHFEGNVGHGLWEYRQTSRAPSFYIEPSVRWFCGHPFGIGCA